MMKDPVCDSTIRNYLKVARQEANLWVMVTDVGHNVTTQYKLKSVELYARGCFRRWKRPSIFTGSSWPLTLRSPRPKCCCLATRSLTSLDAWGLRWKPTGGSITFHHRIWKGQRELSSFYLFSATPPIGPSVSSLVRTHAKLQAETKHRLYDDLSLHRKYSRDRTTFLLEDFNVPTTTLGFTLWVILEQDKWMRMDNACWSSVVTYASLSTTSTAKLSVIAKCPGYTADQIIGINATTSLQRGLPYPVSSSTQPLQCRLWH